MASESKAASAEAEAVRPDSDDERWEDWEADEGQFVSPPTACLFAPARKLASAEAVWSAAKAENGFDFAAFKADRGLDFYGCVRVVNYIRATVRDAVKELSKASPTVGLVGLPKDRVASIIGSMTKDSPMWKDDALLAPVFPDDPLLTSLGGGDDDEWSDDDDEDGSGEAGAGAGTAEVPVVPAEVAAAAAGDSSAKARTPEQENARLRAQVEALQAQLLQAKSLIGRLTGVTGDDDGDGEGDGEYVQDNDTYYFNSYSHVGIHEEMLKDTVRTLGYRDAILKNKDAFKGKVVLDIGCGTGILSMIAASAGASQVIGIDRSAIIEEARKIVKANGLDDKITLVRGKVEEVELPIDNVDIIVSEWMGYALLYESMLPTVLYARDKWLVKSGGLVLPNVAKLTVEAIDDKEYWDGKLTFWEDVYSYDMKVLRPLPLMEPIVDVADADTIFTDCCTFKTIDINTVTSEGLDFESPFIIKATRKGTCHALVIGFDIDFNGAPVPTRAATTDAEAGTGAGAGDSAVVGAPVDGFAETVSFTTRPTDTPTHWKQSFLLMDPPLELEEGATIEGTLIFNRDEINPRTYHISYKMTTPVVGERHYHMA